MQAKGDTTIDMEMMMESTEHLNNLKSDSLKDQITDQSGENQSLNQKISQIDLEFQKLLCQLIESKLSQNTISQVHDLLKRLSSSLILEIPKGPQILNSLYQIILVRKSTIKRNFPFSPLSSVLSRIKKLIKKVKQQILKRLNLFQKSKDHQINHLSSFHLYKSQCKRTDDQTESLTRQLSFEQYKEPIYKQITIIQGQGLIRI
ncbi:unnamed protein product [Paramecium primaurelia]|uniref:Uncharacterized protein n=1 Tax=Paramecium primaurelia TaxID=5886 RepID=A0A8S1LDV3_PARPR|nr:unnamed protein product [Paramecium primaurelia]